MLFHRMSIISLRTRHEWVDKKGIVCMYVCMYVPYLTCTRLKSPSQKIYESRKMGNVKVHR